MARKHQVVGRGAGAALGCLIAFAACAVTRPAESPPPGMQDRAPDRCAALARPEPPGSWQPGPWHIAIPATLPAEDRRDAEALLDLASASPPQDVAPILGLVDAICAPDAARSGPRA